MPFKMIVVEDDPKIQELFQLPNMFARPVVIIPATTITQALEVVDANLDADLMLLDGSISGEFDAPRVLEHARGRFLGKIVAISGNDSHRRKMVQFGCDEECPKWDAIKKVREHLARAAA